MNTYDLGQLVTIWMKFKDPVTKQRKAPDTIALKYKAPDEVSVTVNFPGDITQTEDSEGVLYFFRVSANVDGTWFYRVTSTGDAEGAGQSKFKVRKAVP